MLYCPLLTLSQLWECRFSLAGAPTFVSTFVGISIGTLVAVLLTLPELSPLVVSPSLFWQQFHGLLLQQGYHVLLHHQQLGHLIHRQKCFVLKADQKNDDIRMYS